MAIDSNIAMGVQPMKIESPMNALAQMMQIKHAQQQNRLGELTMQDHQRTYDDTNKLNQAYTGALGADGAIDRNKLFSLVAQSNLGSKIPGLQKSFMETDKATGEVDAQKFKLASERHAIYQKSLGALAQDPALSKDMVLQAGQSLVQQGILPAALLQKVTQDLPDDPEQLRARLTQGLKSQMTPEQIFTVFAPKPEKIDDGGQISFMDTNPNSKTFGKPVGTAVEKVQSPDGIASSSAARANAAATLDAAGLKVDRDTEMKLADDYRMQSKLFAESVSAHKQLTATLGSATTSPAATLAAATKFMKILDPGSVVRESELGMALQASGVLDRAQNYVNILQKGKVLTKTQAADFQAVSGQMFEAAQQVQQAIDADYTSKANGYKVRPGMVVQDLGQNAKPQGKAPPIKDKAAYDAMPSGTTFTAPDGSVRRKP